MTLLNPTALVLLALAGVILLLHFLRSRERRREVSALFLWEGLRGDPRSRAARFRQRFDLFLLLQLAALTALVLALAQPTALVTANRLSRVAIVIDGSASMQTATDNGTTRYELAVERAITLLNETPAASTAVVQWSTVPVTLSRPGSSSTDVERALRQSRPTWYADGDLESLGMILGTLGGISSFDRVLLFSDSAQPDLDPFVEWIPVMGGVNRGLTAFSVRESGDEPGATAFVEVLNDTKAYQDVQLRISDGTNQTVLSLLLTPEETERYVIPFPSSRGTRFTASLLPSDAFEGDDVRYFSLERRLDLRVRWMGEANRYLLAALSAASPISLVEEGEEADLIVAVNTSIPPTSDGDMLLLHSGVTGFLALADPIPASTVEVSDVDSLLLHGLDPEGIRLREIPTVVSSFPFHPVLEAAGQPLLFEIDEIGRRILALSADIMTTNLPITVDFPLLIRNYIAQITRTPASLSYATISVGEPMTLTGRGVPIDLVGPEGRSLPLPPGMTSFRPTLPGHYTLTTDRGAYSLSANTPPSESMIETASLSALPSAASADSEPLPVEIPLWPYALALGLVLLLAEGWAYVGLHRTVRRSR